MKALISAFILVTILGGASSGMAAVKKVDSPFVYARDLIRDCQDFCDIQVADAPAPGQRLVIYSRYVVDSLDAAGFNVCKRKFPKTFRVIRSSKSVTANRMTDAARKAIEDILPAGVILETMGNVPGGDVPTGSWEAIAVYDETVGFQRTRSIPVAFLHEGVPFRKIFVLCRMTYRVKVPVATMDIRRDEMISSADIAYREMEMDTPIRNALLDVHDIVGKKSRGVIRKGSFFESRTLIEIPLVKRGDLITVVSNVNGIRISARGIARQDAVRGARIAVEIPTVGKILFAEIVSIGVGVVQQ